MGHEIMYEATTRNIRVSVSPAFDESRSQPGESQYFWLYTVEIRNNLERGTAL